MRGLTAGNGGFDATPHPRRGNVKKLNNSNLIYLEYLFPHQNNILFPYLLLGWFPSNYVKSVPGGVGATPVLPKTTTSSLSSDPINTNTTITSGASSGRQTPNPQGIY